MDRWRCFRNTDVDCYAEDGSEGVEIWGICYSIENTTAFGWPISVLIQ